MKNKKLIRYFAILILTLIITGSPAYAQWADKVISENSVFVFRFDASNPDQINNYFVKEIAHLNYLSLYKTQYLNGFELQISIKEISMGSYLLQPSITQSQLDGNIFYEHFKLSEVLMPSAYSFDLRINCDSSFQTFTYSNLKLHDTIPLQLDIASTDLIAAPKFKISAVNFSYHEKDKQPFHDRINEINQWLGFYELLDFNLKKSQLDFSENTDSLLSNFFRIADLKRFNELLKNNIIPFQIPEYYQISLEEKQRKLNANLRRQQTLFTQHADTLDFQMRPKDFESASQTIIGLQADYLSRMSFSSHLYEPAYLRVSNFFKTPNDWMLQEKELHNLLLKNLSKQEKDQTIEDFCNILYENYILKADSLIADERFNEASLMVENATTFCTLYPNTDCEILTFNKTAQCKYGIFDAYLRICKSAMEMGKLGFAEKYLDLASTFQKQNDGIIISSEPVNYLLEELAWSYLDSAKKFYNAESYDEALDYYVNAREIYARVEIETYGELIDKQIKKCINNN